MKRNSVPNDRPPVRKIINIELPEGRLGLRIALVIVLIVLAVASFALGINSLVSTDAGLTEITALSGEMNAGSSFTFYYYLGYGGADATMKSANCEMSIPRPRRTRSSCSALISRQRKPAVCTASAEARTRP